MGQLRQAQPGPKLPLSGCRASAAQRAMGHLGKYLGGGVRRPEFNPNCQQSGTNPWPSPQPACALGSLSVKSVCFGLFASLS